ncbi:MAG: DUF423 domain-containing protein [Candidatus Melainabacteria bacterium]|jgi:uncharacterized membrane protein YgdD (TMEM256/DUF423 family)
MIWINSGCFFGFLSVLLGAFGAHFLKTRLSEYSLGIFQIGTQYQIYHALSLISLGIVCLFNQTNSQTFFSTQLLNSAGYCFVGGIIIFSGSLYALSLLGHKWLGAITPIGGLIFLAGWILFFFSGFLGKRI